MARLPFRISFGCSVFGLCLLVGLLTLQARASAETSPYQPRSQELRLVAEAAVSQAGLFGIDERTPVRDTTSAPGAQTVLLLAQWTTGERTTCSGFMIGPNSAGTAGHCLYSHGRGGWAESIQAIPSADGPDGAPHGTAHVTTAHSIAGWTDDGLFRYDIGAVTLDRDIGTRSGWLELSSRSDQSLLARDVGITGYSGDKPSHTQWQSGGRLDSVDSHRLYFRIDATYGNSGGPVWVRAGGSYEVVGVVSSGSPARNAAVRVTAEVSHRLMTWSEDAAGGYTAATAAIEPNRDAISAGATAEHAAITGSGFTGDIAPGLSLVVYQGGAIEQLDHDARAHQATAVALSMGGQFYIYVIGAPAFVNASFVAQLPHGIGANTPVVVRVL